MQAIGRALTTTAESGSASDGASLTIETTLRAEPGASVSVSGCCLTVSRCESETLSFDLMPETLAHTTLGELQPGDAVNLEPALRLGDPLGGHWVQGHVDAIGRISRVTPAGNAVDIEIEAPESVLRYCVERGSIAVDGVSLTVMGLDDGHVRVSLIPETRSRSTLGDAQAGTSVNLETDILARYVERLASRPARA